MHIVELHQKINAHFGTAPKNQCTFWNFPEKSMHRTGSGALIFGIDADLVRGGVFSLFFGLNLSCILILVHHPLNKINECTGRRGVHWKPLILRGGYYFYNGEPVFWGSSNVYWYLLLLLTWPTPFWGRKTQQVHRFFGNMSMDLQARYLTCTPILRVPQVASIGYIYLWFNKNIILYLQKPNTEQKCQASHPPPRYMLLVRNS